MTVLQGVMIFFFAITLAWIAFAAASAIAGLLVAAAAIPAKRRSPAAAPRCVMPVYNEDPTHTTAALQAMAEALAQADAAQHFEIVIISDSTNVDAWIAESLAVDRLRRDAARHHARVVSPPLAQHRPQGRQRRRVRQALGRPLRLHDRARRRQPDERRQR